MNEDIVLSKLFEDLKGDRQPYLDRAEECAKHTLPYAFVEENFKGQDDLERYFTQGYGAMLVKHLVGKIALSILPPSQPFYRLSPTQEALDKVTGGDVNKVFEIEKMMAVKEEAILRNINKSNFRASLYPSLILAVITGNAFVEKLDNGYNVINLRNYVVERDYEGKVIKFVIQEKINKDNVPEDITITETDNDDDIMLYTGVLFQDGKYVMYQEIDDKRVGNEITLTELSDRFIDIGWNKIDGENYRRSFVEDYLGSFVSLEKLTKILYEGIAESSKIIKMVNPNGLTDFDDYTDAEHGDAIIGRADDVTTSKNDKAMDFRVVKEAVEEIKQELARAFLVTGASIRNSERTTAQEVQLVASEVEASLGGIYTSISDDIQRPLVLQAMSEVDLEESKDIDLIITTGVQALGRNVELSKINSLIQELQMLGTVVGAESVAKVVNIDAIVSAMVANSGVASKDFLYSKAEKDSIEVNAKRDAMEQQMLSGGLATAGQNVANQMTGGA